MIKQNLLKLKINYFKQIRPHSLNLFSSFNSPHIKPDTPIDIYVWFCLSTATSNFSLMSPVAD